LTHPIIILRPEPGASATEQSAIALGLTVRKVPLFAVAPVVWPVPAIAGIGALLLTSANAVQHAGPGLAMLAALPCHAVGTTTAAAAEAAGLRVVAVGTTGAQAMIDAMTSSGVRDVLWLAGEDRSPIGPGTARITAVACYRATEIPDPAGWDGAVASPAILLFHSARAARRASALAGASRQHLVVVAISAAVMAAAGTGWAHIAVPNSPTDADMLALAAKLCHMLAR